jgi:hypothetical protein
MLAPFTPADMGQLLPWMITSRGVKLEGLTMPSKTHKEFFEEVRKRGDFSCSFCGRLRTDVDKLISGPLVFICRDCVLRLHKSASEARDDVNRCTFCGRAAADVEFVVGDTTSGICDGCLDVCTKILDDEGMPLPDDIPRPTT